MVKEKRGRKTNKKMRKEKEAVKNQNIFLNNIGLNLGLRLPRIQTYIAKNHFIILLFYSLASEISCIEQHNVLNNTNFMNEPLQLYQKYSL